MTGFYMRATLAFNTFRKTLVMTLSLPYLFSFLPVLLFLIFHLKIPTLRKFHLDVFFYRHLFFSNQSQCCLTFWWIEPYHNETLKFTIFVLCLDLGLFMLFLCDLFVFFFFIFIMINCIIWLIQTHLFFWLCF